MFDQHSKTITGLERLMLESSGFDFRNRYPQRLVLKLARPHNTPTAPLAKTSYKICLDLYRTFAPLKQTSPTMALASVELACRVLGLREVPSELLDTREGSLYKRLKTTRAEVLETLFDLLDLYSDNKGSTLVGPTRSIEDFLNIRIALNNEAGAMERGKLDGTLPVPEGPRSERRGEGGRKRKGEHGGPQAGRVNGEGGRKSQKTPRSPMEMLTLSPRLGREGHGGRGESNRDREGGGKGEREKPGLKDGTVRFMLSGERARDEKEWVGEYFEMVEEEVVTEMPVGSGGGRRR